MRPFFCLQSQFVHCKCGSGGSEFIREGAITDDKYPSDVPAYRE